MLTQRLAGIRVIKEQWQAQAKQAPLWRRGKSGEGAMVVVLPPGFRAARTRKSNVWEWFLSASLRRAGRA